MLNVKSLLLSSFIDFVSFPINSNVAFYSSLLISLVINSTKMVWKLYRDKLKIFFEFKAKLIKQKILT